MRKKIERWIARKLRITPENVMVEKLTVEYTFINPATMEPTKGKKEISLKEIK